MELVLVFGLLAVAVVLFVTERGSFDVVALIVLAVLLSSGILTVKEALSGFSNQATITIAAMFVVSEGIRRTGAMNGAGEMLGRLGKQNYWLALLGIMLVVAVCSAFINNTAAVAIFIPVIISVARDMEVGPSRLLMPMSFAASLSFITPVGYQTNTLVYGPGQYRFTDFTRVGTLLDLVLWIAATFTIPLLWPF